MSNGVDLSLGPGSWHSTELPAPRPRLSVHCQQGPGIRWEITWRWKVFSLLFLRTVRSQMSPGLKESAFNDVTKKRGEDKAKDVKEDRRQAGIPKNKGPKGKAGSPRPTTAHSPLGRQALVAWGRSRGQWQTQDRRVAHGSVSQRLVSPWPEAEDSLAIGKLSLWPSGDSLRQGLARARLPAPVCS